MLPDTTHLLLFIFVTVLLNLTAGSDVLFIGSQSLISRCHSRIGGNLDKSMFYSSKIWYRR